MTANTVAVWDNWARPNGATNTIRPLTRSSGTSREGLAMQATRLCSVDGCDRNHLARGLCTSHYSQAWRDGETRRLQLPPRPTIEERLAARLVRSPNGCLEWTGRIDHSGYGQIKVNGKTVNAHRLAWSLANGPIPKGMKVRHYVCDNPPCCDVSHMRLGTQVDNMADMIAKGRSHEQKKTHCPAGHPYDEANTYVTPDGKSRECRECRNESARRDRRSAP